MFLLSVDDGFDQVSGQDTVVSITEEPVASTSEAVIPYPNGKQVGDMRMCSAISRWFGESYKCILSLAWMLLNPK